MLYLGAAAPKIKNRQSVSAVITVSAAAAAAGSPRRPRARSVEEVAGEEHREDQDAQQAPVERRAVQLHQQHRVVRAGLWERPTGNSWSHSRRLAVGCPERC